MVSFSRLRSWKSFSVALWQGAWFEIELASDGPLFPWAMAFQTQLHRAPHPSTMAHRRMPQANEDLQFFLQKVVEGAFP
jgi:hypothetical protein